MKILQISAADIGGGAEKVAFNLHQFYHELGHQSWLAVGLKRGADSSIIEINKYSGASQALINFRDWLRKQNHSIRGLWRLGDLVNWVAQSGKMWDSSQGIEDFRFPGSRRLLTLMDVLPDIIHAHNFHGGYFDLRYLPKLSKKIPLVITLHDEWIFTGHCAYTMGCERWESGCGSCPDLTIYPLVKKDATAYNWKRKRSIYQRSNLYIATPSRWLMERMQRSMIKPIETRVIPNGVDLNLYYSGAREHARHDLGLPQDARIILGIASQSRFKDFQTTIDAIKIISQNTLLDNASIVFIALGSDKDTTERIGRILVKSIRFLSDTSVVAKYFQAADIFLHAAIADNFPNMIIESLACGTPVIATNVGGISEQVENGQTGLLVPKTDSAAMAQCTIQLLTDDYLRQVMGHKAAEIAKNRYSLEHQAAEYLSWYEQILEKDAKSNS